MSLSDAGQLGPIEWLRAFFGAGISGGAAALSTGVGGSLVDPDHFNIHTGMLWKLVAGTFMFSAFVSTAKFLAIHPLPDRIVRTVEVTEKPGTKPTTVTTTETTSQGTPKP